MTSETAAPKKENDELFELLKALFIAAIIAIGIRSFVIEPFNIPSGSMFPTLKVGDYLFVEKYSYGYSKYSFPFGLIEFKGRFMESMPARGDVAVFRQPKKAHIDYIKRLIGLPGDRIQVLNGVLYINDKPVTREFTGMEQIEDEGRLVSFRKYIETLPNGVRHGIYEISDDETLDNTPEYKVPEGFYFAMGDNRDESLDSRVQEQVGFIPAENLIGRASFMFFSVGSLDGKCDREGSLAKLKTAVCYAVEWPQQIRLSRIFRRVKNL